jgi:DNA-binding NarL/FixJ family response regulator
VLRLLCQGDSNKEIAQKLGVTESDVKYHVSRLLRVHDVDNRVELILKLAKRRSLNSGGNVDDGRGYRPRSMQ